MKQYKVVLSKTAEKDIAKLPSHILDKIIPVLQSLENNPRQAGCKKNRKASTIYGE